MAQGMAQASGFHPQRIIEAMSARGQQVLKLIRRDAQTRSSLAPISKLVEDLLSVRGESAGHQIASTFFACYHALDEKDKIAFLNIVADGYGPDPAVLGATIEAYNRAADGKSIAALRTATESPRQTFFRRLNLGHNGTQEIVRLREDVLAHRKQIANFEALEADLAHVITPWFNIGFLELRQMDWSSPANVLHKIIRYEAVHEVKGWEDLRRRVEPADRRCFAFFHPRMPDEPLIFVEVALMQDIPADIRTVLDEQRTPIPASDARVAVFYSISNCQKGLRGIPFGNTLIKLVVELLTRQLPGLRTFVTLSPVPEFSAWLSNQLQSKDSCIPAVYTTRLANLGSGWTPGGADTAIRQALITAAAHYFLEARTANGRTIDSVARFHLGNGAQLERINFAGDTSSNGLQQSHGLMVNYLYKGNRIDSNAQRFAERGEIAASPEVRRLLARRSA